MKRHGYGLPVGFLLLCAAAVGQEILDFDRGVRDWAAPPYWTGRDAEAERFPESAAAALASVPTSPMPFIGIKPCRIVDTRSAAFPSGYGPPSMAANVSRDFTLAGQCAIPPTAQAVSLNITVTGTQGTGYILIYPKGGNAPGVSTLNYVAGQTIANAAIVPLGTGGVTVVAVVSGTQLLIDTNGYYAASASGDRNTFLGEGAGSFTATGTDNVALGFGALASVTSGAANIALGSRTLNFLTTGVANVAVGDLCLYNNIANGNTAVGHNALTVNSSGGFNTSVGINALASNTTGGSNCALGISALFSNQTGSGNVAVGPTALAANRTGESNTAVGNSALGNNVVGSSNTGVGMQALLLSTGGGNTALGFAAGSLLQTGIYNIYIGDAGAEAESNTTRIGHPGITAATFLSGVRGAATGIADAVPVMVDSAGQLGTVPSSARVKEQIEDMGEASDALLRLRPVTFRWRGKADSPRQFGLIAEEVERVVPELVVHSKDGQAETVLYHQLPAMLLNEIQKQQREIEELKARLAALEAARTATKE